jgi:hypothetical protein
MVQPAKDRGCPAHPARRDLSRPQPRVRRLAGRVDDDGGVQPGEDVEAVGDLIRGRPPGGGVASEEIGRIWVAGQCSAHDNSRTGR